MKHLLLCIALVAGLTSVTQAQTCTNFNDTSMNVVVSSAVTVFATFYADNGVLFQGKYADHTTMGNANGGLDIYDMMGTGWSTSDNSNFDQHILVVGDADLKINLQNISYSNKIISFDISYSAQPTTPNPFNINTLGVTTTLSSQFSVSWTALTNGFHVEITGPVTELYVEGFEVAIDNYCMQQNTASSIKSNNSFMNIYPIPFDNEINLSLDSDYGTVEFINMNGNKVKSFTGSLNKIETIDLATGTYIVRVLSDGKIYQRTVVKE